MFGWVAVWLKRNRGGGNSARQRQNRAAGDSPDARVRYAIVPNFGYKYALIEDACSLPSFASSSDAFSRTTRARSATLRSRIFRWRGTAIGKPRRRACFGLRTRHSRISVCYGGQLGVSRNTAALRIGICRSCISGDAPLDTCEHQSHAGRRSGADRRR